MNELQLVKKYLEKERLNSLIAYWYYFRLWLLTSRGETVQELIDWNLKEEAEQDEYRQQVIDFAEAEREGEATFGGGKVGGGGVFQTRPKFTEENYYANKVRVRTSDGFEEIKYADSLDAGDIVLAYMVWNAMTSGYDETVDAPDNFEFGGGGDFGGAGAGGDWTENTVNNDVSSDTPVGSDINTPMYS